MVLIGGKIGRKRCAAREHDRMRYLTTAAMALALAACAAAVGADPQNNDQNNNKGAQSGRSSGGQGGQGQHGGPAGPAHGQTPQGGPAGGRAVGGPASGGDQGRFGGNGQSGGAGAQTYRGYSRGQGGYVAPNGAQGGQGQGRGGQSQTQGQGSRFQGGNANAFNGNARGGVPGAGHLRARDQGRASYRAGAVPQQFSAQQRFHVSWNNRPNGWYASRWVFGQFLPWGWFAPAYYLNYQDYDLPYPPIGCEWVREGPDAVLVNIWTGEVLSVAYGVFW
jgi:Ni/Co efflux regulator RcnB